MSPIKGFTSFGINIAAHNPSRKGNPQQDGAGLKSLMRHE